MDESRIFKKRNGDLKIIPILLLFFSGLLFSQDPYTVKYSIEEGLPTSNVYCVIEDHHGYIWFGTDVGVLKFDGLKFEHYSTDDGLADNEVFKIFEDSSHRIWFVTLNGKPSYYHKGQFTNTKNNALLHEAMTSKMMVDVYEHNNRVVILYRDGSIARIDFENNAVTRAKTATAIYGYWNVDGVIHYLNVDAVINSETNTEYTFDESMYSAANYRLVAHQNRYLFSIQNVLYEYRQAQSTEVAAFEHAEEFIHLSSIDDALWIGTRNGLIINSPDKQQHIFKNHAVSYVLKDAEGNYWVTTLNDGIKFIPNFDMTYHELSDEPLKINALQKDPNQQLWIGTEKGVYSMNKGDTKPRSRFNSIRGDYIKKIRHYAGKTIVIGNNKITIQDGTNVETYNFGANDFYFDGKKYYFSSSVVFEYEASQLYLFPIIRNTNAQKSKLLIKNTIVRKRTNVIMPAQEGAIFFGTSTGLYAFEKDSLFQVNPAAESLNTSIQDIFYDHNQQHTLVATNAKGVSILADNSLFTLTKKQKLSSNTCYALAPWEDAYLVATNEGLDLIEKQGESFEIGNLNVPLGLKKQKINDIEIIGGTIYIATDYGLLSFLPKAIKDRTIKPRLVLDEVRVNEVITENLRSLNHQQNNISLAFTGISFADYGNLNYEYRINEGPWIALDAQNLEIKNLNSGEHAIELRTKGNGPIWSDIETVQLSIAPPFYKTIPFLILTLGLISVLFYYVVSSRINAIKNAFKKERLQLKEREKQANLEKQMLDLEQKALRMQMNPHFIFNALNTIKGYYSGGNLKEANTYISQLSKLLRLILENDERLISIEKEIEIISLYLKLMQLRYVDVFDYDILIDAEVNKKELGIPTLILQPIVENAVIHGLAPLNTKGQLTISFQVDHDQLVCTVLDNGIGYTASLQSTKKGPKRSKALQITSERIAIENGVVDARNFVIQDRTDSQGTEVIIRIPITKIW